MSGKQETAGARLLREQELDLANPDDLLRYLAAAVAYYGGLTENDEQFKSGLDSDTAFELTVKEFSQVTRKAIQSRLTAAKREALAATPEEELPDSRTAQPIMRTEFLRPQGLPPDWIPTPAVGGVAFDSGADQVEAAHKLGEVLATRCGVPTIIYDEGVFWWPKPPSYAWVPVERSNLAQILYTFSGAPCYELNPQTREIIRDDDGDYKVARLLELSAAFVAGVLTTFENMHARPGFFAPENVSPGIAFSDCFVRLVPRTTSCPTGRECQPNSPDHRVRWARDFPCPPVGAIPRRALGVMRKVFRYGTDPDAQKKIDFIQEFVGGAHCGISTRYQRGAGFVGTGGNGKSCLIEIIQGSMPPGSVSAVSPQADQYQWPRIRAKLLNAVADIPKSALHDTAFLKMSITGDWITCRDVGEAAMTFQPIAAHLYGMNGFPDVKDQTPGFTRRWVLIAFDHTFEPAAKAISRMVLDPEEGELPELIGWFMDGAVRLMTQKQYTIPECHARLGHRWSALSNPVGVYIEDRLIPGGPRAIQSSEIYEDYVRWHYEHPDLKHDVPVHSGVFGRRLSGDRRIPKSKSKSRPGYVVQFKNASQP